MIIEQIRKFTEAAIKDLDVAVSLEGLPLAPHEVADPTGGLPILIQQAMETYRFLAPPIRTEEAARWSARWSDVITLVEDHKSLTGYRVDCINPGAQVARYPILALLHDSLILAQSQSPVAGNIDLAVLPIPLSPEVQDAVKLFNKDWPTLCAAAAETAASGEAAEGPAPRQ